MVYLIFADCKNLFPSFLTKRLGDGGSHSHIIKSDQIIIKKTNMENEKQKQASENISKIFNPNNKFKRVQNEILESIFK